MVRKVQKTRSRTESERDEMLAHEELSGGGARPRGVGGRRNAAPGAQEFVREDYDEEDRRHVGGEGGGGIQTGTHEEDDGPGALGQRNPEFETEPTEQEGADVLRPEDGPEPEVAPTGAGSRQQAASTLESVPSRKARTPAAPGRGVGIQKRGKTGETAKARKATGQRQRATPAAPMRGRAKTGRAGAGRALRSTTGRWGGTRRKPPAGWARTGGKRTTKRKSKR